MRWLPFLSILTILIFISSGITGSYKESAHGNSNYGVYRLSGYSKGNCAHCHEMHTGNGSFALFANNFNTVPTGAVHEYSENDDICFYCHSAGGITNYDYSKTFGGAPINPNATNIMDAFNQDSYHNLYDIWFFANSTFSFFTPDSNPCVACHNPHIAQRSCGLGGNGTSFDPTQSAISRPKYHGNLWGDDDTERMNKYNYQPPYCYNKIGFEPDCTNDTASTQASKTPDYVTFCTNCHDMSNQIYSTTLGRDLKYINWNTEIHGKGNGSATSLRSPYTVGQTYVLSCMDCHEPHGSSNSYLLRSEVNGKGDISISGNRFYNFCYGSCHNEYHRGPDSKCGNCHYHGNNF